MTYFDHIETAIAGLTSNEGKASISMAAFDGDMPEYRNLATTKDVIKTFKKMIGEYLLRYRKLHKDGDLRLVKYTSGFKPDSYHVEHIKVTGSNFESIINSVPSPADTKLLSPDDTKYISRLKFYVIIMTYNGKRILFFKRYSKTKELGHKNGFLISWIGTQYAKVSDSVFTFDDTFDCMVCDGILLSFNKKNTEVIFKYYEDLTRSAFSTIDKIAIHIPIHNLEEFKNDCSTHLHKLDKLRNIAQKGYLPQLDIEKIKEIIFKFHLQIKIVVVNGKELLEHDTNNKWALLNLLDDSYLSSLLTGTNYEVNSKIPI